MTDSGAQGLQLFELGVLGSDVAQAHTNVAKAATFAAPLPTDNESGMGATFPTLTNEAKINNITSASSFPDGDAAAGDSGFMFVNASTSVLGPEFKSAKGDSSMTATWTETHTTNDVYLGLCEARAFDAVFHGMRTQLVVDPIEILVEKRPTGADPMSASLITSTLTYTAISPDYRDFAVDLDKDGNVTEDDRDILLDELETGGGPGSIADLNFDNVVNVGDSILFERALKTPTTDATQDSDGTTMDINGNIIPDNRVRAIWEYDAAMQSAKVQFTNVENKNATWSLELNRDLPLVTVPGVGPLPKSKLFIDFGGLELDQQGERVVGHKVEGTGIFATMNNSSLVPPNNMRPDFELELWNVLEPNGLLITAPRTGALSEGIKLFYDTGSDYVATARQVSINASDEYFGYCSKTFGDIDQNGTVEFADFLVLSANFGESVFGPSQGDLDCSGVVDFADFLLLSANFGQTVPTTTSNVPEPNLGRTVWITLLLLAGTTRTSRSFKRFGKAL